MSNLFCVLCVALRLRFLGCQNRLVFKFSEILRLTQFNWFNQQEPIFYKSRAPALWSMSVKHYGAEIRVFQKVQWKNQRWDSSSKIVKCLLWQLASTTQKIFEKFGKHSENSRNTLFDFPGNESIVEVVRWKFSVHKHDLILIQKVCPFRFVQLYVSFDLPCTCD